MRADRILKCHGFCRLQREQVLADSGLVERLEALPEEYDRYDVEAALEMDVMDSMDGMDAEDSQ